MFDVVQLENGRYALRNTLTGLFANNGGKVYTFNSVEKAVKKGNKLVSDLSKTLGELKPQLFERN